MLVIAEIMVEAFVRGLVDTSGDKSGKRVGKQVRKQRGKHMGNTWGEILPGTLEPPQLIHGLMEQYYVRSTQYLMVSL